MEEALLPSSLSFENFDEHAFVAPYGFFVIASH